MSDVGRSAIMLQLPIDDQEYTMALANRVRRPAATRKLPFRASEAKVYGKTAARPPTCLGSGCREASRPYIAYRVCSDRLKLHERVTPSCASVAPDILCMSSQRAPPFRPRVSRCTIVLRRLTSCSRHEV
jgi:hypothetical protein